MLHWAEGSKDRNKLVLTNSDPELLGLYVRFLREALGVPDARIVLSVTVHEGLDVDAVHRFWLGRLALPPTALRKPTVVPAAADELRRRKLPYGTARVVVHSTALAQHVLGAIQQYGGFERPSWD